MTDELERGLREALRRTLPAAPDSLRSRIDVMPTASSVRARPRTVASTRLLVAAAIVIALAGIGLIFGPGRVPGTGESSASPSSDASPSPSPSDSPSPSPAIEGRYPDALSVSEFLASLPARTHGSDDLVVRGYWTPEQAAHSCTAPDAQPGELQIRCHDGHYGLTESDEPLEVLTPDGRVVRGSAIGPVLTPFFDDDVDVVPLLSLPIIHGQFYPPVPIVLRGHIDDPRATDCQPEALEICRDRFVVVEILDFDPDAVPTPGITPSPSPFPFDDPPAPMFDAKECAGDVAYSFVGWTTMSALELDSSEPNLPIFAAVTRDVIEMQRWSKDGETGELFRLFGRRICLAREWDGGSMGFGWVPGTAYREWEDGRRTPEAP